MSQVGFRGGATSLRRLWESGGEVLSRWAIFCKFLKKIALLMPFGSHFAGFQRHLKRTKFFEIRKPIEQIPPFTSSQVQNTFKIFHFGVKFCDLAWSGESRYIAFCNLFSIKSFTRKFAFEDFCFVMKITSFRYICTTRSPCTLDSTSIICWISISPNLIFFKSILLRENWRDGGGLLFKVGR